MSEWFLKANGRETGPMSSRQLAELARDGEISPVDLVRRSDKSAWVEAGKIQGLRFSTPASQEVKVELAPVVTATVVTASSKHSASTKQHVNSGFAAESLAVCIATIQHLWKLPTLTRHWFRRRTATREAYAARIAIGRELFENNRGAETSLQAIRSTLSKLASADPTKAKALSLERDSEFANLVSRAMPSDLDGLPSATRFHNATTAQTEMQAIYDATWRGSVPRDVAKRQLLFGYGIVGFVTLLLSTFWLSNTSGSATKFEGEIRSALSAGRPTRNASSGPRIDDVSDGVARGFLVSEAIAQQQVMLAAFAELQSAGEGDKFLDSLFKIYGYTESEIIAQVAKADSRDYRGRTALNYTIAYRLSEYADNAEQHLATVKLSGPQREALAPIYRRFCKNLSADFEAVYKSMVAQGSHLLIAK